MKPVLLPRVLLLLGAGCCLSACVVEPTAPVYEEPPPPPPPTAVYEEAPPPVAEVTVAEAPPPLPDYEQPPCPEPGYLWTPGYWGNGSAGYYWIPGTWVQPPRVGVLWTPAYWGYSGGVYAFHAGYWGPHVGFYGGVNYGFGYGGTGYAGGRWNGGVFAYNTAVNHVDINIVHNTYNETVINNYNGGSRASFNGPGGANARPTPMEMQAEHEQHFQPTGAQFQHQQAAGNNPGLRASANNGHPAFAATSRPGAFNEHGAGGGEHGLGGGPAGGAGGGQERNEFHQGGAPQNEARPEPARAAPEAGNGGGFGHPPPAAPHAQNAPRPQAAPHPQARPQAAPRTQAAPHPQGGQPHAKGHGPGNRPQ